MQPSREGQVKPTVPMLYCPECGVSTYLHTSYWNYEGVVPCGRCAARWEVRISGGEIRGIQPAATTPDSQLALSPKVPGWIAEDFQEAVVCVSARCYKAALVMCRRCLQGALLERGIADKRLFDMLQEAQSQELLDMNILQLARGVKGFGDVGAHPQDIEIATVNSERAPLVLQITKVVLETLYRD